MFGTTKDRLINGLSKLAANLCSYTKQPCDCKYIGDQTENIARGSERGSGCPETTMAALLIANMTNQEFLTIARRAGISITEDDDLKVPNVFEMIKEFQEAKWKFKPEVDVKKTTKLPKKVR